MTRETKIGLLVGLAFIIVIGILLSDHLTSSTEPPPATLANAGNNVRQTVTTPGSTTAVPVTTVSTPAQVAPQQPVPTPNELQPRPQPVQIVQVGGPAAPPQQQPPTQGQPAPAVLSQPQQPEQSAQVAVQQPAGDAPIITQVPQNVPGSLAQAAQQHGEGLVGLDAAGRTTQAPTNTSWATALTGMNEYKAEPGDSLSKMAVKLMGANTRANRDAIVRANPSLRQNPDRVIAGQSYVIPTAAGNTPAAQASSPSQQAQMQQAAQTASASEYFYTVRENDSLWRIANDQLGNPNSVAAIKELNKEALRGGDVVFVGMKLKLPGKPLARSN